MRKRFLIVRRIAGIPHAVPVGHSDSALTAIRAATVLECMGAFIAPVVPLTFACFK